MKTISQEERREALKSLVDTDVGSDFEVVDRSAAEHAMTCPWQAKAIETGRCKTVGILAEAGEAAHKAFGDVLHSWIDSHGAISKSDLIQDVEFAVRNARPDLQPEAIRSIQSSIWNWATLIVGSQGVPGIHPTNILGFDGGEDIGKSGQLAIDFPDLRTRYTSELDFLYQGDSQEVANWWIGKRVGATGQARQSATRFNSSLTRFWPSKNTRSGRPFASASLKRGLAS